MQKCTAKVKTQMTKTNAIKGGKNYSKNKTASKKNNLNDSAPLYIPQYTQTNTHHPFVCMPTGHSNHNNTKQQFQIICSAVF